MKLVRRPALCVKRSLGEEAGGGGLGGLITCQALSGL